MVSDKILKKYCNLFSLKETEIKKIRFMIQDVIGNQQLTLSAPIGLWANLYPSQRLIFISFNLKSLFAPKIATNVTKIIIPLDFLKYFKKIILLFTKKKIIEKSINIKSPNYNFEKKQTVAFVVHKGLKYNPSKNNSLFDKNLYYSNDKNSSFNKYNILHLDYDNYPNPDIGINWVNLKKEKVSRLKIYTKTILACLQTFYLIRSYSTFFIWLLLMQQYRTYLQYSENIKKFKNLKIAIIDYDYLCPKTLIFALEKNNIKTIATQERFIMTFFTSFCNIAVDTYYVGSEYAGNIIKKSKYYDVKNIIPVGQYRSDYLLKFKNEKVPNEIAEAKKNGKKIISIFAHQPHSSWVDSRTHLYINWTAINNFLEECLCLAQKLENVFIILRYKEVDWLNNPYFHDILQKLKNNKNIIISKDYSESFYSYKLCAHSDLILGKYSSILEECLSQKLPVLIYEKTHNTNNAFLDLSPYTSSYLVCSTFEELLEKCKSVLLSDSNKLKQAVKKMYDTIYYVHQRENVKIKIFKDLEKKLI